MQGWIRITCCDWSDDWSEAAKDAARKGKGASLARGVKYLGMPIGNRAFLTAAVQSSADRGAMEDVHSLRLLGHNAQEKLLILRHCVSSKLAHIARWGPADEYEEETEELNRAIERVVRDLAGAPSKELFPAEAMELARLPSSMGGMGLTKLTAESAAVAGMCSAASALARMGKAFGKRKGLEWLCTLISATLEDPEEAAAEEAEDEQEAREHGQPAEAEEGAAEEEEEGWSVAKEARARATVEAVAAARAARQQQE